MPVFLTDENFEEEILGAKKPVLVDFWMQGCGPCFLLSPILEKLAKEFEEKIVLAKVNLDAAPLRVQKYGINVAPTIILFKEGKPASGFIGLKPEETIRTWLEENLQEEGEEDKSSSSPFAVARENEKIGKLIQEYEEYAKKNGFFLNPNHEMVEKLVKCMIERERRFGKRYCCCRRIKNDLEEDEKIICPCIYVQKEIGEQGKCLCGLFVKNIIK